MKKFLVAAVLLTGALAVQGQLGGVINRAKQKAENKAKEVLSKKENKSKEEEQPAKQPDTVQPAPASFKSYSKYDFVPGEKVIGFEDYSTGNIGDFPAGWNTSGSAEIVTVEGKPGRWLLLTKPGVFMPEFTESYPEDFTLELDVLHGSPFAGASFRIVLVELDDVSKPQNWTLGANNVAFEFYTPRSIIGGSSSFSNRKNSVSEAANQVAADLFAVPGSPAHISIWRQKERVRLYANQSKVWDLPKGISKDAKFNAIVIYVVYADETIPLLFSNFRLAVGAPDTRNKFLTQNKWVTHGILFDVNSANIKPESYGTLKEMANVLKENADVKVQIVGHTDSDGSDANNLDLSKRRAASVKAALAKEFGIDEGRMETDGKGENEPIDKATTPAAKANNRRVEFIKL